MKVDFNKFYMGVDGEALKDPKDEKINMGKNLSNHLCGATAGIEPAKAMDWARQLYKGEPIEIDKTDLKKLTEFIKTLQIGNLVLDQLLSICDIEEIE